MVTACTPSAINSSRPANVRQPISSVARARCAGRGSTIPTSSMPGKPANTRAWLLPMMPAPMTPTRSARAAPAPTADPFELILLNPDNCDDQAVPYPRPGATGVLARRHKCGECPRLDPKHVLIQRITPFCRIPERQARAKSRLRALIIILDADDVVLAEIAAGLHLDQLQ